MPAYTDSLFGIAILILIIAIALLVDFFRNRYRNLKKTRSLNNLTKSYEFIGLTDGVDEFLKLSENPIPTLEFVANAYIQSGNTQEAIKIYLSILENLDPHNKEDTKWRIRTLQSLGVTYYKAGFLQRAKNIFLEILKNYPKNPEILIYLLKTYENLNEHKKAIEALLCIEELYENNPHLSDEKFSQSLEFNKLYLQTLLLINDHTLQLSRKITQLNEIRAKESRLEKIILRFYKDVSYSLFWEEITQKKCDSSLIDLLWSFERHKVPLDRIQDPMILDVYRAKGWLSDEQSCAIFELENLRILNKYSSLKVDIDFEYRCHSCKNIFPFENARCSSCGELLNTHIIFKIRKKDNEASYPLL